MTKQIITQKELKEILHYDPETGVFIRKMKSGKLKKVGSIQPNGYLLITINRTRYYAHRLAFICMGKDVPDYVDHINHIKSDNRWCNLAKSCRFGNARNQSMHSDNTSGANGVHWNKDKKKWHATYRMNGKNYHVGYFNNVGDAAKARKLADIKNGFHPNHGD